jgi:Zn-dependent metalloprotease
MRKTMPTMAIRGEMKALLVAVPALLLGVSAATEVLAQSVEPEVRQAIGAARRGNPRLNVSIDPVTGLPTSIRGITPRASPSVSLGASSDPQSRDAAVRDAVSSFFKSSDLSSAFPSKGGQSNIQPLKVRPDPDVPGQNVVLVEQRVNGLPVFGSSGKVIVNPSLAVTALTASFSAIGIDTTTPTVTEAQAITAAKTKLRDQLASKTRERSLDRARANFEQLTTRADLMVFDPALMRSRGATPGPARLAWMVQIDTFRLFVDAATQDVLFVYRDQPTASAHQIYDLAGSVKFPGKKIMDETDNSRAEPVPEDGQLAYDNAGIVFDYLLKSFGRKGIGDSEAAGTVLESYIRYGDEQNAYWCNSGGQACPKPHTMVYGPGFAQALDVVGHEMTHGIISEEAKLNYADESGAVNESLADIFGTLMEFHANPANGNWVLGEALPGFNLTSPLRSMAFPNMMDPDGKSMFDKTKPISGTNRGQPDHYSDYVKRDDPLCETTGDYFNGCVHFNSGILNKFAFLISEGGPHRGVEVQGIGRAKLGKIAYRALTTQLNASSGLIQAADAFVQSCQELAAANAAGITGDDCGQVGLARSATGLVNSSS